MGTTANAAEGTGFTAGATDTAGDTTNAMEATANTVGTTAKAPNATGFTDATGATSIAARYTVITRK